MEANFFKQIEQMDIEGQIQLLITKGAQNSMVVSILLKNEQWKNNAKNLIPPLNLRGSAEELDKGFFEEIKLPLTSASGIITNTEMFFKQLEKVEKKPGAVKSQTERQSKENPKERRYTDAMTKVKELEKVGKYSEAWTKVPQEIDFPEKAEEIRKRKTELSAKFAPQLFGDFSQTQKPIEQEKKEPETKALYPAFATDEIEEEMEFGDEEQQEY